MPGSKPAGLAADFPDAAAPERHNRRRAGQRRLADDLNIAITVAAIQHLAAGAHRVEGLPVLIVSAIAALVMRKLGVLASS